MTLRDSTRYILNAERPEEWLHLADMYIGSYNQMPDAFVLPADHAILQPVIAAFHNDIDAFIAYIEAIRNHYPPGDQRLSIHTLYRTILTRSIQQSRRDRRARALAAVERAMNRKLDADEREAVGNKLEQRWASDRREFLKSHRALSVNGRLSTDVRAALLKQFWAEVDDAIARGDLPIFKLN